jgi:uncharacterized protein YacL (UPF0231 family)
MMAAILTLCGAVMFSSCSKDDDNGNGSVNEMNLKEKIIGKWMPADKNGQPMITDRQSVYTFLSTTKAYKSASIGARPNVNALWGEEIQANVAINDNKATLTSHPDENTTITEVFNVTDINDKDFTAYYEISIMVNGKEEFARKEVLRLKKVTDDYKDAVIGTWEGRCTSEGSVFDDGQEHRWEYKADGTYVYYVKDGDNWVPSEGNTLNEYFVDGNLLCTRWVDNGVENREWWEINIDGDKMTWTALRQNEDGTTFTASFEMKKVELNVKEKIMGKWMTAEVDGESAMTDKFRVFTFVSDTKAYVSASRDTKSESFLWTDHTEADVTINGNKMTITFNPDERTKTVEEYIITDINDKEFAANHKINVTVDGKVTITRDGTIRYVKQTADYSAAIIGLWECTGLSGIETYNDANARLEFATDGTYKYWQKNDFNVWNAVTTREFQNYFVDGTLLATRWKDHGDAELREWWEIESITDDEMTWKALRQNEEGEIVEQKVKWRKVGS